MTTLTTFRLISSLAVLWAIKALDVELEGVTCDQTLPVTAKFYLRCDDSSRCTFGGDSTVYGTLTYNGVDDSGIQNNVAYVTSDLSFWTLDFNLFDMLQVPLCGENVLADENNTSECPGDGKYDFQVPYKLPSAGTDSASWLASGWEGSGSIAMYAEPDVNMKIGECTMDLQTYVTKTNDDTLLDIPSAAVAAGIALGAVCVIGLIMLYCYCCCKRRKAAKKLSQPSPKIVPPSDFSRMDDDTKSILSGNRSIARMDDDAKSILSGSRSVGANELNSGSALRSVVSAAV